MLSALLLNFSLFASFTLSPLSWYFRLWGLSLGRFYSLWILWRGNIIRTYHISSWIIIDTLSASLISLTWWISLLTLLASHARVKLKVNKTHLFTTCICALNLTLLLTFLSCRTIWFYVFFEASLIPTFILILGWGYQPERTQAGIYILIYTLTASLPLLIILLVMVNKYTTDRIILPNLLTLKQIMPITPATTEIIFVTRLGAFLVKLPIFSLHLWLPKAHVEAPVAGSIVLAGILLKLGGYGMLRIHQFFSLTTPSSLKDFIFCFALYGGVVTSFICFRQVDLKSLIAYSSIGHISLVLAGIFSGSLWGWQAALRIIIAHGLCSSGLFALTNYNYEKTGTRRLIISKGILLICPVISMWWFLFCAVNMAAPPSINLLREIIIFPAVLSTYSWLLIPLILIRFLAAVYNLFLYTATQHGRAPKYLLPLKRINSTGFLLFLLHYIPVNALILKTDIICTWTI